MLAQSRVVQDRRGDQPIVLFYKPGVASAVDAATVAGGRDVGTEAAFDPTVDGRQLRFKVSAIDDALFVDEQTGSVWNILGQAAEGPLKGQSLTPIVGGTHFWFAWAAFKPDTEVYAAP